MYNICRIVHTKNMEYRNIIKFKVKMFSNKKHCTFNICLQAINEQTFALEIALL